MTDSNSFFNESKKEIENYLENRALLMKMQVISTSSRLVAKLLLGMVLGLLGFCLIFFLSFMAGYFFADLTGSLYMGYGIVVVFYLLLFLIFACLSDLIYLFMYLYVLFRTLVTVMFTINY